MTERAKKVIKKVASKLTKASQSLATHPPTGYDDPRRRTQ